MIKADLASARAAWIKEVENDPAAKKTRKDSDFLRYKDTDGRFADFHCSRHTYLTQGGRSGASLSEVQRLARHSTPVLTARYIHIERHDARRAGETTPHPADPKSLGATGTDGNAGDGARQKCTGKCQETTGP